MLALGVGVGLGNGLIITKLRVNAFIATLGIGADHQRPHREPLRRPARARATSPSRTSATRASASSRCRSSCCAVVAVVIFFLLRSTRFGYRLYAVGGDEDVSKLSGLRTHRTIIAAHVVCSL